MKFLIDKEKESGFTLMEILVALSLISIAMLSMASLTMSVIKSNSMSFKTIEGLNMAEDTMEFIKSTMSFDAGSDNLIVAATDDPNTSVGLRETDVDAADDVIDMSAEVGSDPTLFTDPDVSQAGFSGSFDKEPQWVYNIKDNFPINGMKTIVVIVGWNEGGADRFVALQSGLVSSSVSNRY